MELFAALVYGNAKNIQHFVADWRNYYKGAGIESIFSGSLVLRNNYSIDFDISKGVDWAVEFSGHRNSNYLWFYSLEYVGTLLDAYSKGAGDKYLDCATDIVDSFCRYYHGSEVNKRKINWLNESGGSIDHAISTRANALVKYVCTVVSSGSDLNLDGPISCIYDAAMFMMDDQRYSKTNHGTMADIALSQVAVLAGLQSDLGRECFEKSNDRLIESILRTFDVDGFANENTIGYHRFNMELFKSVISNFNGWKVDSRFCEVAPPIIEKALRALQVCVWQDGSIPPIGDSAVYEKAAESINESKAFLESGLAIIKSDDLYVSFVCGRRGDAHKQVDDTSITVRYKNTDIVIDGGNFNYNRRDPYRRSLESSFGHSGVFPGFVEGVSPGEYLPISSVASITSFTDYGSTVEVSGKITYLGKGCSVQRMICVIFPRVIIIRDLVFSNDPLLVTNQRLLFGHTLDVVGVSEPGVMTLQGNKFKAVITINNEKSGFALRRGVGGDSPRGWFSQKAGKKDACYELMQSGVGSFLFETKIEILPVDVCRT